MDEILVCDDEKEIVEAIEIYLSQEKYLVHKAYNGEQALALLKAHNIKLVVLDIMMPELDGFSACREIRKISNTPIIMLSARGEEYDKINGFEVGIDDYVVKPFSPKELMMRIDAVMKRYGARDNAEKTEKGDVFSHGTLSVDMTARIVCIDGHRIDLSPKEYGLLFYLIKNKLISGGIYDGRI